MPRALKWAGGALAAVVLVLLLMFVLWSAGTVRDLDARTAALRAAGEPIEPADFAPKLSPGQDAMEELRQAFALVDRLDAERWKRLNAIDAALPLSPEDRGAIADALADVDAAALLRLVDDAASKPGADWRFLPDGTYDSGYIATLTALRRVANLVEFAALAAAEDGRHDDALAGVSRMLVLADAAEQHPTLIGHLIGVGLGTAAADLACELAPTLRIGAGPGEVRPDRVAATIERLLDESSARRGFAHALRGERSAMLKQMDMLVAGVAGQPVTPPAPPPVGGVPAPAPVAPPPTSGSAWGSLLARPYARGNTVVLLDHLSGVIRAVEASADQPAYDRAVKDLPTAQAIAASPRRYMLAAMLLTGMERSGEAHFRGIGARRLAAAALAARRYRLEHCGAYPESLSALTPRYLLAVPGDPVAGGTAPIRYDPARRLLWHAGADGRDHGGQLPSATQPMRWNRENADVVRRLERPVTPPDRPRPAD